MDEPLTGTTAEGSPTKKALVLLCTPSWLSCLLCLLIAFGVVVAMIGVTQYRGSAVQEEFLAWRTVPTTEASIQQAEYSTTALQATTNTIFTFVFWSFIGLFGYYLAFGIYNVFHVAESFKEELHYVHADRRQLLRDALLRIGIRFTVLAAWFVYIVFFFRTIAPYSLTTAHAAAGHVASLSGIGSLLGAALLLFGALHAHIVLLRLLLFRPRVFHSEMYL